MTRKCHVRFGGGQLEKGRKRRHLAGCLPYYGPLTAAIELIRDDPSMKTGDILCITDGQFGRPPEEFLQLLEEAREEPGLKLVTVVINGRPGQAEFADKVVMISDIVRERERLAEAISPLL